MGASGVLHVQKKGTTAYVSAMLKGEDRMFWGSFDMRDCTFSHTKGVTKSSHPLKGETCLGISLTARKQKAIIKWSHSTKITIEIYGYPIRHMVKYNL